MESTGCLHCDTNRGQLEGAHRRIAELDAEVASLRAQLREVLKQCDLQKGDLDRYRDAYEKVKPNHPERVPRNDLQLAFERVIATFGDAPPANDAPPADGEMPLKADEPVATGEASPPAPPRKGNEGKRRDPHGRRRLDLTNLPVEIVEIDPDEVMAASGAGFVLVGDETAERIAFRPGGYIIVRFVRRKFARLEDDDTAVVDDQKPILVAPLPDSVWPRVMADPSAIASVILKKYDDSLPLNRQEKISGREGFVVPRSTQCGWLGLAHRVLYRVVEAMFAEGKASAFCIATDATGAPVRAVKGCDSWHVFVFIADRDHVVFRHTREQTSVAVQGLLGGFRGYLLADAAIVYDAVYRGGNVVEVGCWFHMRRYFYRALETERESALEALALVGRLFEIERECRDILLPVQTEARAHAARPVLEMLDKWIDRHRGQVDPRGPLDKAIGYYDNQRAALRRFLEDGRLRLDNNISEGQLRNLALGRDNWKWFENETGLRWYTTFRSLIASCALHDLNPQDYIEQLLRLAPHWPVTRMLELSPKHWARTVAGLDARMRKILARPWEIAEPEASTKIASADAA